MTKAQQTEREKAIEQLREWIKPGDTVYTILDHVSRSGMQRAIRVVIPIVAGEAIESAAPGGRPTDYVRKDSIGVDFRHPNYAVGKALGLRHWKRNGYEQDALMVGGCGMDMGFHLVYNLSYALYGKGYACLGKGKCPSNYHTNHRDTLQCQGTVVYNPDGPNSGEPCHWERGKGWVLPSTGNTCPTCQGKGRIPNPEGPERWDLIHTDGYALRHRWL